MKVIDKLTKKGVRELLKSSGYTSNAVNVMLFRKKFSSRATAILSAEMSRRGIEFDADDFMEKENGDTTTEDTV